MLGGGGRRVEPLRLPPRPKEGEKLKVRRGTKEQINITTKGGDAHTDQGRSISDPSRSWGPEAVGHHTAPCDHIRPTSTVIENNMAIVLNNVTIIVYDRLNSLLVGLCVRSAHVRSHIHTRTFDDICGPSMKVFQLLFNSTATQLRELVRRDRRYE